MNTAEKTSIFDPVPFPKYSMKRAQNRMEVLRGKCPLRAYTADVIARVETGRGGLIWSPRFEAAALLKTLRGIAKRANKLADRVAEALEE